LPASTTIEGFTDIEIVDFDEAQIEAFTQKWFVAVGRNPREKGLAKAAHAEATVVGESANS